MTSGAAVKYKNSMDCGMQILKNEGFMSMMRAQARTSSAASPAPASSPASTPSRESTSRGEWETKTVQHTRQQHTDSTSPPEPFYEDLMKLTACHFLVYNCAEKQPNIQFVVHYSIASTLFLPHDHPRE